MATDQQIKDAANKQPRYRSPSEQALVSTASANGNTTARNLDFEAARTQRAGR